MRFLFPGIGVSLVVSGLIAPNLATVAVSLPNRAVNISQQPVETNTIRGNGVEFVAPSGFRGGMPSAKETQFIVQAAAAEFPAYASLVEGIFRDPSVFRLFAINTAKSATKNVELVLVQRLPVPVNTSLADLNRTMKQALPSVLPPEFKLVDSQVVTVGSRQIVRCNVTMNVRGLKFYESMALIKEGDEVFQLIYGFAHDRSGQADATFDRMIRTFKSTPTTLQTSPI